MVQHRAPLGLRHRRPGAGPLVRRLPDRRADDLVERLRAPAAARLLYPVRRRRSRQRGRDHGFVGARGAHLQIRLGHRLEFLETARRRRAAVGRRALLRADELPEDRRPRRRCDQIRRHHPARRQDGDRRHRPPRHRGLYRLEGDRGAEGRGARRRLQARRPPPEPDHGGLPWRRSSRGRPLRPGAEPGLEARDPRRPPRDDPGELHPARDPVRAPGRRRRSISAPTTPIGIPRPI